MKAESKRLLEAEKLINTLMEGIPDALQTLQDLQSVALPCDVTPTCSFSETTAKLLKGIQAYEAWASQQGAWASR